MRSAVACACLAAGILFMPAPAMADAGARPSGYFMQLGFAEGTQSATLGLTGRMRPTWEIGGGRLTTFWEASVAMWSMTRPDGAGRWQIGQIGLSPMLRYTPSAGSASWFIDAGIGATWTTQVYATDSRQFSTCLNFGDQVGIGWIFGASRQQSLSLRFEHFSNADIVMPNPGANFLQLRYELQIP